MRKPCAVPGCRKQIRQSDVFCWTHWMQAPKSLQHDMLRALGQVRKAEREGRPTAIPREEVGEVREEIISTIEEKDDDYEEDCEDEY